MTTSSEEPKGCLAAILSLFGINLGGGTEPATTLPYRLRDDFLSPAEYSLYRVLIAAVGNRAVVCPKVNLNDVFFVARPSENQAYRNKIDRKHLDLLLCHPTTMKPLRGVELDESSHLQKDRRQRDEFVDQVFAAAGLPIVQCRGQSELRCRLVLLMPNTTTHNLILVTQPIWQVPHLSRLSFLGSTL